MIDKKIARKLKKKDLDKVNTYLKTIGLSSYGQLSEDDINMILKTKFAKVYQYFLFIMRNGRILHCIHKDYDLLRTYKRFHKLIKWRNENIDLDRKYINEGFIQPVLYELVLAKRFNRTVDKKRILTDEYGRPYEEELIRNKFLVLARKKHKYEEFFTLFPYDRKHIRFSIANLYYGYLLRNINNDEVIKSVYTYNNNVVIHHDSENDFDNIDNIDVVTTKNPYDAQRVHEKFREWVYKREGISNPYKIMFWGEPEGKQRMVIRNMIQSKTNWSDRKMVSKTTKTSPL